MSRRTSAAAICLLSWAISRSGRLDLMLPILVAPAVGGLCGCGGRLRVVEAREGAESLRHRAPGSAQLAAAELHRPRRAGVRDDREDRRDHLGGAGHRAESARLALEALLSLSAASRPVLLSELK